METRNIQSLDELHAIARSVVASIAKKAHAPVVALSGDLGAGKTAFVKQLAAHLNIKEEITSPTFVIMKSYVITGHPFLKTLTHIDAYRVDSDDEMRVLGFEEILNDPTQLVAIEWPERIQDLIPKDAHAISIVLNGETRTVTF